MRAADRFANWVVLSTTLSAKRLPDAAMSSVLVRITSARGLPVIRLRSIVLRWPPPMPMPVAKPPSACEGESASTLSAIRLPTTVLARCGVNAS